MPVLLKSEDAKIHFLFLLTPFFLLLFNEVKELVSSYVCLSDNDNQLSRVLPGAHRHFFFHYSPLKVWDAGMSPLNFPGTSPIAGLSFLGDLVPLASVF